MILESIKKMCKERGITIAKLERETKIGNGTIARWGKSTPRIDSLKSVADYFGVTLDELLKEDK